MKTTKTLQPGKMNWQLLKKDWSHLLTTLQNKGSELLQMFKKLLTKLLKKSPTKSLTTLKRKLKKVKH